MPKILQRLALSEAQLEEQADDRTIDFVFSTSNVASDMHRILPGAWQSRGYDGLAMFRTNPVFLWAHDANQPAIGKVTTLVADKDGTLRGSVQFAEHDFAETIYQLYRGGFQRGASVSFEPIEWDYANGPNRAAGALDFTRVKLWEISAVPLPADSSALAAARARGIDLTGVITMARTIRRDSTDAEWKCGASRNLPIDEASDWDGPAAADSVFAACGFDGDDPDTTKARKAFLAYDSANPKKKESYKLPFAKMVDGRMTAVKSGLSAAAQRLSGTNVPDDVKTSAQEVIDDYKSKYSDAGDRDAKIIITKRGLYEVAWLCEILATVGWIKSWIDQEEAAENDVNSTGPANLMAVINALGTTLTEMTEEEVGELIASFGPIEIDDEDGATVEHAVARGLRAQMKRITKLSDRAGRRLSKADGQELEDIHDHARRSRRLVRAATDAYSGADLSDADAREAVSDSMEAACDHAEQTRCMIRSYIDARKTADPSDQQPDADDDSAVDERARKARARQKKQKLLTA
ncbi:hypothetical protein CWB41_13965 [Methylovirgula ligni]|uniref:HK97 family phage prohead protease n=1 Tax=Methylovirgula ligni TaxID=569860 RepID=A0A3D9YKZ9_9HYPH|nr:HK97 family phage prohead protease [Methylovirgula ligni]QAY96699.1 hypothetical protein CWB41_13965 [Methylovirgula ligni]REF83260.1 HK97 family phage prohead protease [Methylovirgula ligni]